MKTFIQSLLITLCLSAGFSAFANNDKERETLSRILVELDRISYLSAMAEIEQSEKERVQFDFNGLHQDIHQMKHHIQAYLAHLPQEPRTLTSIEDDYLTMQRSK